MTGFTNLSDTTLAQDKPLTQSVARAFRDNPLAIQEGSTSAPKIIGLNPDTAVTASNATSLQYVGGFSSLYDKFEIELERVYPANGSSTKIYVSYTTNGGSSWSGNTQIATFTLTREVYTRFTLYLPNTANAQRLYGSYFLSDGTTGLFFASINNASAINGIRFTFDASNVYGTMTIRPIRKSVNVA